MTRTGTKVSTQPKSTRRRAPRAPREQPLTGDVLAALPPVAQQAVRDAVAGRTNVRAYLVLDTHPNTLQVVVRNA